MPDEIPTYDLGEWSNEELDQALRSEELSGYEFAPSPEYLSTVVAWDRIRVSPADPTVVEVRIHFDTLAIDIAERDGSYLAASHGHDEATWIPLAMAGMFEPQSVWHGPRRLYPAEAFKSRKMQFVATTGQLAMLSPVGLVPFNPGVVLDPVDYAGAVETQLLLRKEGRTYALAPGEILRFYFAAQSLVAGEFLKVALQENPFAHLVDQTRTRWVDEEAGVFQIAPKRGLQDRGSAMQLAVLLLSPDLQRLWRRFAAVVYATNAPPNGGLIATTLPEEATRLEGLTVRMPKHLREKNMPWGIVSRILADNRPPPFAELVIDREGFSAIGPPDDELPREERQQGRTTGQTIASGNKRSSRRSNILLGAQQSFLASFPRMSDVRTSYP